MDFKRIFRGPWLWIVIAVVGVLVALQYLAHLAFTGDAFYDPAEMTDGFHMGMVACAVLAAIGGVIAWLTISDRELRPEPEERKEYSCSVTGPPVRPVSRPPAPAPAHAVSAAALYASPYPPAAQSPALRPNSA